MGDEGRGPLAVRPVPEKPEENVRPECRSPITLQFSPRPGSRKQVQPMGNPVQVSGNRFPDTLKEVGRQRSLSDSRRFMGLMDSLKRDNSDSNPARSPEGLIVSGLGERRFREPRRSISRLGAFLRRHRHTARPRVRPRIPGSGTVLPPP